MTPRCKHECCHTPTPSHVLVNLHGCCVLHLVCLLCRSVLSLGPANDRGARVKIEIRAAGIAARAVNDWPAWEEGIGVEIGWEEHQIGSARYLVTLDRWAGYLAREIHSHSDDHGRGST